MANANQPTSLAFVPGGRLLIAEEAGVVRVYKNGALNAAPALDIRARVCSDGERGLMAVAVDPQFETNHFIYVYYTWVKNGCVYDDANTRSIASRGSCCATTTRSIPPPRRS